MNWIVGLFYNDFEQPDGVSREYTPGWAEYLGGSRPDNLEYISVLYEDLTESALYGEVSFDVTDRWQITVGTRYYDYSYEALSAQALPLADTVFGGAPEGAIDLNFDDPAIQDDSGSLFKFNTAYRSALAALGYFTISEGYGF